MYLYSSENPNFDNFFQGTIHASVYAAIGRLLRIVYTIQMLVVDNSALSEGWEKLRKMLLGVTKEPGTYEASPDDISLSENSLFRIHRVRFPETDLLDVFFNSLQSLSGDPLTNFVKPLEQYLDDEIARSGDFQDLDSGICDLTLLTHLLAVFKGPKKRIIQISVRRTRSPRLSNCTTMSLFPDDLPPTAAIGVRHQHGRLCHR
jgi:hypothetical protein